MDTVNGQKLLHSSYDVKSMVPVDSYSFLYLNHADSKQRNTSLEILECAWDMMQAQRLVSTVFYDGAIRHFEDMASYILRPGYVPVATFSKDGRLAALTWLNGFEGKTARGHFVFFKEFWGRKKSIPLGRALFRYLLTCKDAEGYLWDALVGITPTSNRMAWQRAIECGAVYVGVIPYFCSMPDGSTQDGVAVAVTRATLNGEGI